MRTAAVTYVIGVCLMVAVAVALAALACILRRKHKRNQALMAAEREARLVALRQAEALEMARLAELGLHPHKAPVVVVQPDGEATLAEQLGAGTATVVAVAVTPPGRVSRGRRAPDLFDHSVSLYAAPAIDPSLSPRAQQRVLAMQSFLMQQQHALEAQAAAAAAARAAEAQPPPNWRQADVPSQHQAG